MSAHSARRLKSAIMNAENPKRRGKQAKFKARFAIFCGAKPALAILLFDLLK